MVILRLISGAFEAVAKPAFSENTHFIATTLFTDNTVAITAMWFTRIQQPIVIGTWYASQGVGIGLGGLIGYGIGQIEASIAAWRFEFIIIGAGCAVWGIVMAFIIPDSPYTTKRFTREEKIVIMSRKREDYHAVEKRQLKWDQASYDVVHSLPGLTPTRSKSLYSISEPTSSFSSDSPPTSPTVGLPTLVHS
jgi:MFS family permease